MMGNGVNGVNTTFQLAQAKGDEVRQRLDEIVNTSQNPVGFAIEERVISKDLIKAFGAVKKDALFKARAQLDGENSYAYKLSPAARGKGFSAIDTRSAQVTRGDGNTYTLVTTQAGALSQKTETRYALMDMKSGAVQKTPSNMTRRQALAFFGAVDAGTPTRLSLQGGYKGNYGSTSPKYSTPGILLGPSNMNADSNAKFAFVGQDGSVRYLTATLEQAQQTFGIKATQYEYTEDSQYQYGSR